MKYVALDIGNVLCHLEFSNFLNKLSEELNITIDESIYFMNRTQKLHDLGYTSLSDELRDHFKVKSPIIINKILDSWNSIVIPSHTVIDKFNELRKNNNLKIALLSNIGLDHASIIGKKLEHNAFYASTIKHFSCNVGARKPSMLFYQSFLLQYPEFKGCVYVDDLVENLQSSEQFGFKTFEFSLENYFPSNKILNSLEKESAENKLQEILNKLESMIIV